MVVNYVYFVVWKRSTYNIIFVPLFIAYLYAVYACLDNNCQFFRCIFLHICVRLIFRGKLDTVLSLALVPLQLCSIGKLLSVTKKKILFQADQNLEIFGSNIKKCNFFVNQASHSTLHRDWFCRALKTLSYDPQHITIFISIFELLPVF